MDGQIFLIHSGIAKGVTRGAVCEFGLLRHENALGAAEFPLQVRSHEVPGQRRPESHLLPLRIHDYA